MTAGEIMDQIKALWELDPEQFTDHDCIELIADLIATQYSPFDGDEEEE